MSRGSRCAARRLAPLRGARAVMLLLATLAACTQETVQVPVRSLERSGDVAFVCLGAPPSAPDPDPRPLGDCLAGRLDRGDYSRPHLHALVTQTTRGEVAVLDLTAFSGAVLDVDPVTPGATFVPVGAQPVDIVASPGGTASFVAVAEPSREGIYGLPSARVRSGAPRLTSFPACALGTPPGSMVLVNDPPDPVDPSRTRPTCDAAYGESLEPETACGATRCHGDLLAEDAPDETGAKGRPKLVITLPERGEVVVVDAQRLLDRDPGTFDPCPVERRIPLELAVPPPPVTPPPEPAFACVYPEQVPPPAAAALAVRPGDLALGGRTLYVADQGAPLVHVLDVPTPCDLVERPPLVATSVEDPSRLVRVGAIAVSSLTGSLRRFLYAADLEDASLMAFDVSDNSTSRFPLRRDDAELNPFQPLDRTQFLAPVADIVFVTRDLPAVDPTTGVAAQGVACDPDDPPDEPVAALYRTSADFSAGAAPRKLRGTFAFVILTSGQIVVLDVEDLDAPCRGPRFDCPDSSTGGPGATGEPSCRVARPHQARSAFYFLQTPQTGNHLPGLQTFPRLFRQGAVVVGDASEEGRRAPRMRGVIEDEICSLVVGSEALVVGPVEADPAADVPNNLCMQYEDPRAHVADQTWAVTFEGQVPGFGGKVGRLQLGAESLAGFDEASARFCDAGVLDLGGMRALATSELGVPEAEADAFALAHADRLQITGDFPAESDPYWTTAPPGCSRAECSAFFGHSDLPLIAPEREVVIAEAYQDRLVLADNGVDPARYACCFPTLSSYTVRAGQHWIVTGSASGFLHHVIADPGPDPARRGRCVLSCEPKEQLRSGRAFERRQFPGGPVFRNPFFRFALYPGTEPSLRDAQFLFGTVGSFVPLLVNLALQGEVHPQSARLIPPFEDLAVADGALEGLMIVDVGDVSLERTIF